MKLPAYDITNLTVTQISKNQYVEFCTLVIINRAIGTIFDIQKCAPLEFKAFFYSGHVTLMTQKS